MPGISVCRARRRPSAAPAQELYDAKYVRFNEDNFTFNRKRLSELCRLL